MTNPVGLIQGLSYAYPTSGTIRLGSTRASKRGDRVVKIPVKEDEFTLTTKVKDGEAWQRHPLDGALRAAHGQEVEAGVKKLREIPVRLMFDRPELNMAEQYAAFTNDGRPLCVGDGSQARRRQPDGQVSQEDCPGALHCAFGAANRCDAFLRLLVRVEGQSETEAPFILRTGSVNAVVDNRAVLEHWAAMYQGRLAGLPFTFKLDAKQSALSRQSVFYFGRLEPAFGTVAEGAKILMAMRAEDEALGIDRSAAEQQLLVLRGNGAFAEVDADAGEQFDDLLAGRFTDEVGTEKHETRVVGEVSPLLSPTAAGHAALAQLAKLVGQAEVNGKAAALVP